MMKGAVFRVLSAMNRCITAVKLNASTQELIEDNVCFLYGDTWYEEEVIDRIMHDQNPAGVGFYGNGKDIAAVKVHDSSLFRVHVKIVGDSAIPGIPQKNVAWKVWHNIWQS